MRDLAEVFSDTRKLCVAFDLTLATEEFFYGTPKQLYQKFLKEGRKGEFVVVMEGK